MSRDAVWAFVVWGRGMDWSNILSSQGLATVIVVAIGVGLVLVCRFLAPLVRDLFGVAGAKIGETADAHNQLVSTLEQNSNTTTSAIQHMAVTLDGHGAILRNHSERLDEHGELLRDIHGRIVKGCDHETVP